MTHERGYHYARLACQLAEQSVRLEALQAERAAAEITALVSERERALAHVRRVA